MMEENLISTLSSVLFAVGDPVPLSAAADAAGCDIPSADKALKELSALLDAEPRLGLRLVRIEDKYQLTTLPENAEAVKKALQGRRNSPLSNAALEVLAVIAYNQPTTKAYVEQVRGVESGQVVAGLLAKELIEERGRLDAPGRPILYGTTDAFLRCFGVSSLSELPELPVIGGDNETLFVQETMPGAEDVSQV